MENVSKDKEAVQTNALSHTSDYFLFLEDRMRERKSITKNAKQEREG